MEDNKNIDLISFEASPYLVALNGDRFIGGQLFITMRRNDASPDPLSSEPYLAVEIEGTLITSYYEQNISSIETRRFFIDEVDVSGMSGEEARAALDAHVDKLADRSLEVDVNGETVTTTLAEIGYACETEKAIEEAVQVGKEGNMFSNYAEIKKVAAEHKVFPLSFSYSEKK